ncbi:MAG: CPBP family glutamic-type intramembrane protease [Candidatus Thermoplasmatota archaeon]|nr:CPBP family glutamic-type intramembrane protease [Candidatus Thermoplasmatota archaeon]
MTRKIIDLILRPLCFIAILLYGIFLASAIALVIGSSFLVLPFLTTSYWVFFVLIPLPLPLFQLQGHLLALYYILVVLVILLSFIWLLKSKKRADSFITLAQVFLATLFFIEAYYLVLRIFGAGYVVPSPENLQDHLFKVTNACFHEELICRVLLLGLPLFFVRAIAGKVQTLKSYILGGNLKLDAPATFFLILSSLIFACAHYLLGWDLYKILPAFIAGLALGYLFLKFGLHISILLHLSFNYLGLVLGAFGTLAPLIVTVIYTFLLFIGFIYFLKLLRKGAKFYLSM